MKHGFDEEDYPITFKEEEAKQLGHYLASRDSVELIGMKRVGISNFLRFFLYHQDIAKTYIDPEQKHVYILVDLNNLIETELVPFWRLTLKRIVDTVNEYSELEALRKPINDLFLKSIQMQDLFFTVDSVKDALVKIVNAGFFPTIYFVRFDRLQGAVTPELFSNLQGIIDATGQKLAYVFTSYRELHELSPKVFQKAALATFAHKIYLKPANDGDMEIILDTQLNKYHLKLDEEARKAIIQHCGGHVQMLQLSIIIINEILKKSKKLPADFIKKIEEEERVLLQSEELFGTLSEEEQVILLKVFRNEQISPEDAKKGAYLFNTGYIQSNGSQHVFSPFFANYLQEMDGHKAKSKTSVGFTKKEQMLYDVLTDNKNEICEREDIIQAVWPECNEIGVSDWALDRLVSRLRNKMKENNDPGEILTVKTRGFRYMVG